MEHTLIAVSSAAAWFRKGWILGMLGLVGLTMQWFSRTTKAPEDDPGLRGQLWASKLIRWPFTLALIPGVICLIVAEVITLR
jgi:hypothetical protein